jgi:iron-sulfur cluster assembly accessory protein|tara:strand:- start:101 stop:427 length:327 start_codon:yes stop_codon:yes gene_type:complete
MKNIIKNRDKSFILSATSGGCNGFNYDLRLINKIKFDSFFNRKIAPMVIEKNNIKLLVDPMAEMILLGTKIDYINEDYVNDIFENKFIFIPDKNNTTSCGCGISFTPM